MSDGTGSRREFIKATTAAAAGAVWTASKAAAAGNALERGDLQGRFVYGGDPPERKPIVVTADKEFCGKHNLLEEHLVVNPGNRGLANVFIWLYVTRDEALPAVPASYGAMTKADVALDCRGCRFGPHARVLWTTQTLLIRNLNPIGDSAKIDTLSNPPINLVIPIKGEWRQTYAAAERLPARVSCSLHPWESGWLLVKDHPYMAVSDADGRFVIKGLPPGKWTFQFWHEQAGYLTEVQHQGAPTVWKRGRAEFEVQPGLTDLGELLVAPERFAS